MSLNIPLIFPRKTGGKSKSSNRAPSAGSEQRRRASLDQAQANQLKAYVRTSKNKRCLFYRNTKNTKSTETLLAKIHKKKSSKSTTNLSTKIPKTIETFRPKMPKIGPKTKSTKSKYALGVFLVLFIFGWFFPEKRGGNQKVVIELIPFSLRFFIWG